MSHCPVTSFDPCPSPDGCPLYMTEIRTIPIFSPDRILTGDPVFHYQDEGEKFVTKLSKESHTYVNLHVQDDAKFFVLSYLFVYTFVCYYYY